MGLILIKNIDWDTEGETRQACALPAEVLVVDVPEDLDLEDSEVQDILSNELSEAFGFAHGGYKVEPYDFNKHLTHAGGGYFPEDLAVMVYPD